MSTTDLTDKPLNEVLRGLREGAGLSLRGLHSESGIAVSSLARLESGEITEPQSKTLKALAPALGVELEVLYEAVWRTAGTGPGLPSLETYLKLRYGLERGQIGRVREVVEDVTGTVA